MGRTLVYLGLPLGFAFACAPARTTPGETVSPTPRDPPSGTLTAEDIQRTPSVPIEELLKGKIAGVWVSRTSDGGIAVRIRASTTIIGNQEPLYLVDGVPFAAAANGGLTGIAATDIESIEVVKDAAGMAMYGVRGANGVIIIKTKRASQ